MNPSTETVESVRSTPAQTEPRFSEKTKAKITLTYLDTFTNPQFVQYYAINDRWKNNVADLSEYSFEAEKHFVYCEIIFFTH